MEQVQYFGEHLLPGQIGHMFIVLGFVASLFAAVAYAFSTNQREEIPAQSWRNLGRLGFMIHGLSVFGIIGIIFYLMTQKFYEYSYVFQHVSDDLPFQYIFSAFWEGQEGSFLLWMFWHVVLGVVLILTAKKWESPVMSVMSMVQLFLGSMLLGLYFTDSFKLGSNPLLLLRDVEQGPLFMQQDYVEKLAGLADGLNPLLQNYWMTIHPPTLFLGFASTTVPFAFAIAGLWRKEHKAWLKPTLSWGLFSAAILGTGILMGGAWAYEALSFGGYWAWDPVENMSLVPWLVLVAGLHTNLVAKATGHSIRSTYIYYFLTFILILYSTFLTRSGVLGESSVHAFTEMGLEWQLVAFIVFFAGLSIVFLAKEYKSVPAPVKEEPTASREFWMFIGSLVLLFSGLIITASTSLPVYNQIRQFFDPTFEGSVITDPIPHYNKYQIWIAVFMSLLTAASQFLRYREINFSKYAGRFWKHMGTALLISIVLSVLTAQWIQVVAWQYIVLMFCGIFTAVANLDHLITQAKGNWKLAGSGIAHFGFGIMIIGILASGLNKEYISKNPFVQRGLIEGASEEDLMRNVTLRRGKPLFMSGYEVTYNKDTVDVFTRTFEVNFKKRDEKGEVVEEFYLYPNILYNKDFTKIVASNPSTRRYWNRDVFTHVSGLPAAETDVNAARAAEDSLKYEIYDLAPGDTAFTTKHYTILEGFNYDPQHQDYKAEAGDIAVGTRLAFRQLGQDTVYYAEPMLLLRQGRIYQFPVKLNDLSLKVKIPMESFDQLYVREDELAYNEFNVKQGGTISFGGYEIEFQGFNRSPEHPNYFSEEGDLAVGARLNVSTNKPDASYDAEPIFVIRGNRTINVKDNIPEEGLHINFLKIDPESEQITLAVAKEPPFTRKIPLEVAENALASDYIVLEAIRFPGINLFWLGSTLMMIGLAMAMVRRIRSK
jgi:cytochrome c-type biogenesis protein CcmF